MLKVPLDPQEHKEVLGLKVPLDPLEHKVQQVLLVLKVLKELLVLKVL